MQPRAPRGDEKTIAHSTWKGSIWVSWQSRFSRFYLDW